MAVVILTSQERSLAISKRSAVAKYLVPFADGLLKAMSVDSRYSNVIPSNIRVMLVLESKLPPEYRTTARVLGLEVIENVRVKE